MKISEIITDKYKLRIPPTVYYDLLADVQEVEEEQEPQSFEWCDTCKEYDQEKHCCHRWTKVIRDTVEEMKQGNEREVLDKLRAEIAELTKCPYGTECLGANCPSNTDCMICGDHVLEIIDKYKAESEDKE